MSRQRHWACPRASLNSETTLSPRKSSMARPPVQAARPDSPTRSRNEFATSFRAASFFSGTACERATSLARPSGNDSARNSTPAWAQASWSARMRTINALSHRPSSCASNCMAFTPPLTSSCWTAYALGMALRSSQSPASLTRSVPSLAGWAASTGAMEADVFMAIISVQVGRAASVSLLGNAPFAMHVRHWR